MATLSKQILREATRVLAPGGLQLHVEQPQYTDDMPLIEQFLRDWDSFNNNEPFWSVMHGIDLSAAMEAAGLPRDSQFITPVRAVVDRAVFNEAPLGDSEDFGRAAAWHAYGAWKPAAASEWEKAA
eukprot:gene183-biopygen134